MLPIAYASLGLACVLLGVYCYTDLFIKRPGPSNRGFATLERLIVTVLFTAIVITAIH